MSSFNNIIEEFVLEQSRVLLIEDGGWIGAPDLLCRTPLQSGVRPAHPGALLYQWVWDRKIFAVTHQGTDYFPGFAMLYYPTVTPVPALAMIMEIMGASDWALAAWFCLPHALLAGRRPRDLLLEYPEFVINAARQTDILRFSQNKA